MTHALPVPTKLPLQQVAVVSNALDAGLYHRIVVDARGTELAATYRRPGQFVAASAAGEPARFFALANPVACPDQVELLVAPGSPTGDALGALRPGERLGISAALGMGYPVETLHGRELVVFATGTGIAAVRPLLAWRVASGDAARTWLYQAHSPTGPAFADDLPAWANAGVGVATSSPGDGLGFVQDRFAFAPPVARASEAEYVICGSEAIQAAIEARLRGLGVPPNHVHYNY